MKETEKAAQSTVLSDEEIIELYWNHEERAILRPHSTPFAL